MSALAVQTASPHGPLLAALAPERRDGARQRLMMRVAKLRCRSGEYPCVMHDVSETGTRLRLFHGHPAETHMYLELANGELYALERRWIDGEYAGFRFSSLVDVDELILETIAGLRRPIRLRVAAPVSIVSGGERHRADLIDLSRQGACIETALPLAVGSIVRLDLPGYPLHFGHVCWRKHGRHGVVFQQGLALEALAQVAVELQPFEAEPAPAVKSVLAQAFPGPATPNPA